MAGLGAEAVEERLPEPPPVHRAGERGTGPVGATHALAERVVVPHQLSQQLLVGPDSREATSVRAKDRPVDQVAGCRTLQVCRSSRTAVAQGVGGVGVAGKQSLTARGASHH